MRFLTIVSAIILTTLSACKAQTQQKEDTKPNIVIINVDDMGWRDVGFMGSEYYETPNIDGLSKEGIVFTNGYAASANCAPSRA